MNTTPATDPRTPRSSQEDLSAGRRGEPDKADEFNPGEFFANLWEARYLFLGSVLCCLAIGVIYAWTAAPVYQVEGLLQTEPNRTYASSGSDFTKMEGAYALPTIAEGEIEIIKSNLVLGRVVAALRLDVASGPVLTPWVGRLLMPFRADRPAIAIDAFSVPERLRGLKFRVVASADGSFLWEDPYGRLLGRGRPGQDLTALYWGNALSLKVRSIQGRPGQAFFLVQNPMMDVIAGLRLNLEAEERGKNTFASSNILGLTLQAPDPEWGARILNEILNQYIRQGFERKAGETTTTLALLQKQRPLLQAQVAEAEGRLNEYRSRSGSVDLAREGDLYLQEGSSLDAQISALQQKRQELLRTYTERSDVVVTIDQQIARLRGEERSIDTKVSTLPHTEQEFVRLTRDAQIKSEMYTSLLSSIQQLETTLAGSVGSARVVDFAIPDYDPIAPKKKILVVLFLFIGCVAGVGLAVLRRMFRRGIEDHRIIEARLGLPVLVTIPHSEAQDLHDKNTRKHLPGSHLLTVQAPEDLATESLRSLRTVLHFSMENTASRTVLVTGPSPKIGKSFISSNLAIVLSQAGGNVLLVDADLRNGFLHRTFGLVRPKGLSDVLSGRAKWNAVVKRTEVPGLSLISTGELPPDPLVLLMAGRFAEFTAEVAAAFDYVIFDGPPLLAVTDAVVIGAQLDTVLLVAKYGVHPLDELRTALSRLKPLGDRLKGCIFNDIRLVGVGGRYGYYKYDYAYKYQKAEA